MEEFLAANARLKGKNIVCVAGFEQPELLNFSLKLAARHLTDATVIILDNSRRKESRAQIESVCRTHGAPYLGLPENPSRHPNRNHGMAMTWIWHNVVKPLQPGIAGFIDHDVIPTKRVEFKELRRTTVVWSPERQSIWQVIVGRILFLRLRPGRVRFFEFFE